MNKKEKNLRALIAKKMVMMHPNVGNFNQNSSLESFQNKEDKKTTTATIQHDLGSKSRDETKVVARII